MPVSESKNISKRPYSIREFAVIIVFTLILVVLGGRLAYLQIIKADEYSKAAEEHRINEITVTGYRGTIYDSNGNVLAIDVEAYDICVYPPAVTDAETASVQLANVFGETPDYWEEILTSDSYFEYIARKATPEEKDEVVGYGIDGIYYTKTSKRSYPNGDVASQIIGIVNTDGEGVSGLEAQYDDILSGTDGEKIVELGNDGTPIVDGVITETPAKNGKDIIVSVDIELQTYVEKAVQKAQSKYEAQNISCTIISSTTGEIYCAASTPMLRLSDIKDTDLGSDQLWSINSLYEPGSTLKTIVAASLINEGIASPSTKYKVKASIKIPGSSYKITDAWARSGTETMSLQYILTNSSNCGIATAIQDIEDEVYYKYLKAFGFTEASTVDYPGSATCQLEDVNDWNGATKYTVPFGQGISVTGIQLLSAYSAFNNGGYVVSPHFLLDCPSDPTVTVETSKTQVISEETADTITEMLKEAATEGTVNRACIEGYTVAGKTGTAEIADTDGTYIEGSYMHSFVGYFPEADTDLMILVTINRPKDTSLSTSKTACKLFADIGEHCLDQLRVEPDSE